MRLWVLKIFLDGNLDFFTKQKKTDTEVYVFFERITFRKFWNSARIKS